MMEEPQVRRSAIFAGAYLHRLANPTPLKRNLTYLQRAVQALYDADAALSTYDEALEFRQEREAR